MQSECRDFLHTKNTFCWFHFHELHIVVQKKCQLRWWWEHEWATCRLRALRNSVIWRINSISNEYHVFEVYVKLSCSSQQCHWTFSEKEVNLHKHILHLSSSRTGNRWRDSWSEAKLCALIVVLILMLFPLHWEPMRTIKKSLWKSEDCTQKLSLALMPSCEHYQLQPIVECAQCSSRSNYENLIIRKGHRRHSIFPIYFSYPHSLLLLLRSST